MPADKDKQTNKGQLIFKLSEYLKALWRALLEAGILVIVAAVGYALILYFFKMLWHVYISTHVGQYYVEEFSHHAQKTADVLGRDLLEFSVGMSILSFLVCMAAGIICQVLQISRYIFLNQGIFGRIVFCGLPLAALAAYFAESQFYLPDWGSAFTYSLLPTLIVFAGCFNLANKLFPEISYFLDRKKARRKRI